MRSIKNVDSGEVATWRANADATLSPRCPPGLSELRRSGLSGTLLRS
jgi:hypothetical protein